MKKPQIDIYSTQVMGYIQTVGWKNKFIKYWGTEKVDGIEVLKKISYTHPKTAIDEDLLRHLKVYAEVMASDSEGIVSAWLYINPDKFDVSAEIENDILANKINRELEDDKQYTIHIVSLYGSNTLHEAVDKIEDLDDYNVYMENLREYIKNNYVEILNNYTVEGDNDNSIAYLISKYAMMPDVEKLDVDITDLSITVIDKPITYKDSDGTTRRPIWYAPRTYKDVTITITLSVHKNSLINATDPIFIHIAEGDKVRALEAQQLLESIVDEVVGTFNTLPWRRLGTTNDYFYRDQLRVSVFKYKESGIKVKDVINLVTSALDSDYQKKKAKWYKKLIGIVVFVVAFILAIPSGGASLAAAAATMTLGEVAFALAIAALAVNLTVAAMSMWGDTTGAQANQPFAKAVGVLSSFVSVVSVINNVATKMVLASATEAVKREAMQQATAELGTEASKEVIKELARDYAIEATRSITIDGVKEYMKELVRGTVNSTLKVSLEQAVKGVNFVAKLVIGNETKNLQKSLERKNNALLKQEEEMVTQTALQRDLSMAFMNSYTKPLEGMKEPFEVDWQYEGTSGPLHIGNIQIRYHA